MTPAPPPPLSSAQLALLVTIANQSARFYGFSTPHGAEALRIAEWARAQLANTNGKP